MRKMGDEGCWGSGPEPERGERPVETGGLSYPQRPPPHIFFPPALLSTFSPARPPPRMLKLQVSSSSPDTTLPAPTLAELSRNASVISSSSSNSSCPDLTQTTPVRPRPLRNFSAPRTNLRSRSPRSPTTPHRTRPPAYLTKELGYPENDPVPLRPSPSRTQSKSRNSSVTGRMTVDDFEFMEELGQGSYSTVSPPVRVCSRVW